MKKYLTILFVSFLGFSAFAETLKVVTKNGKEQIFQVDEVSIQSKGLGIASDQILDYQEISYIGTDDVKAYEKLMKRSSKKGNEHLNIAFTGDKNLYAHQLEKLEKRRNAAHVTRGAGGLLMIIGAVAGDRSVFAAGAATLAAGTVARDINTEKTISAQNDAIIALQDQQKAKTELEILEEDLRKEWGSENVDGLIALVDKKYDRALALANVGETSGDQNHQLGSSWLKAIIYTDNGDTDAANKEYELLAQNDPEMEDLESVQNWMKLLMEDLEELRKV